MKHIILSILFLFIIPAISFSSSLRCSNIEALDKVFKGNDKNLTFVLYDVENNIVYCYNKKEAEKRYYPASTFKIYNSLIGLESGVIKDEHEKFYIYDGRDAFIESWKQDTNLDLGIKTSNVHAYQQLALLIGRKRMQEGLNKLNYGNKKIGKDITSFWLTGPLKISALEQALLISQLAKRELPFSKRSQDIVNNIILLNKTKNYEHYGKTGWAVSYTKPIGLQTGYIKKNGKIYGYSIHLVILSQDMLYMRDKLVKKGLKALEIIE